MSGITKILEEVGDDNCADPIDRASRNEDVSRIFQIQSVQRQLAPQSHPDFDGAHCVECGNDMLPERLAMKRVFCTECQTAQEKLNKLWGRS